MANRLSFVFLRLSFTVAFGALAILSADAATLSGNVQSGDGAPLADAIVTATPTAGQTAANRPARLATVTLDQHGKEFVPHVLPVAVGTPVVFPNSDEIQHHVYSFSPAKRFEIKLYKHAPAAPVVFDQPGIASLGCNIHDWMLAYVFVTDAPYFGKTDSSGHWSLELPAGEYRLALWHPDADNPATLPRETVQAPAAQALRHTVALKSRRQTGKPPNALQLQEYADGF